MGSDVGECGSSYGVPSMPALFHRILRCDPESARGVTSTSCIANRSTTSPSIHRTSRRLVRSVMRAGSCGVAPAFVEMLVRELEWIRSGSNAAGRIGEGR